MPAPDDAEPVAIRSELLGVAVRDVAWFRPLDRKVYLTAGRPAPELLRVPAGDAQLLLRRTIREVAGIAPGAPPDVVWTSGDSELLVRTKGIGLACAPGLVTLGLPVACDQLERGAAVQVPFAVGTQQEPAGLVMSAFTRPAGPATVIDVWADALTAFAWEALIHLAQALCAAAGNDSAASPLVPGLIGAERDLLLIQPMARHRKDGQRS